MVQIEASEHLRLSFDPPDPRFGDDFCYGIPGIRRFFIIFLGGSPFFSMETNIFLDNMFSRGEG